MEFDGEEFEALDAIIRSRGGAQALKTAIRLGLFLLVDEKTLKENGKIFSEIYISSEHRERILAGESLVSIASGLAGKEKPVKQKKNAQKNEKSASENVENNSFSEENTLGNNESANSETNPLGIAETDKPQQPNSNYDVFMDESPF